MGQCYRTHSRKMPMTAERLIDLCRIEAHGDGVLIRGNAQLRAALGLKLDVCWWHRRSREKGTQASSSI